MGIHVNENNGYTDWNCTTEEFFCFENDADYSEPDWSLEPPSFLSE